MVKNRSKVNDLKVLCKKHTAIYTYLNTKGIEKVSIPLSQSNVYSLNIMKKLYRHSRADSNRFVDP